MVPCPIDFQLPDWQGGYQTYDGHKQGTTPPHASKQASGGLPVMLDQVTAPNPFFHTPDWQGNAGDIYDSQGGKTVPHEIFVPQPST
jgi:hypothetical protein